MAEDNTTIGYNQRDLLIQTKTLVEGIVGDISEMRILYSQLRSDVDDLKTARAVELAENRAVVRERGRVWTRTEKAWGFLLAMATLTVLTFGPAIEHGILGH